MDSFMIRHNVQPVPEPLRIEGVTTKMTPHPDDAEVAAQALLENLSGAERKERHKEQAAPANGTADYYRIISHTIRNTHSLEAKLALRYITYCEQQIFTADVSESAELESGLYRYQACAEREGGEIFHRWQHILAMCVVRQMSTIPDEQ